MKEHMFTKGLEERIHPKQIEIDRMVSMLNHIFKRSDKKQYIIVSLIVCSEEETDYILKSIHSTKVDV